MHFLALLLIFHRHLHLPLVTGLYTGYHQQLHVRRELGNREKKNNLGIHIIIIIIKFITGSRVRWIEAEKSLGHRKRFSDSAAVSFLGHADERRNQAALFDADEWRPTETEEEDSASREKFSGYISRSSRVCVCVCVVAQQDH
jgi:hypothetical protein